MRRITLLLAAGMLAACNEIPSGPNHSDPAIEAAFIEVEPGYSPGCFELTNNVTGNWDGYYAEAMVGPLEFYAGEVVSISAGLPAETGAETVEALYNDGSWSEIENGQPFPATHTLTIRTTGSYTFWWFTHVGESWGDNRSSTWTVSCSNAPVANADAYATDEDTPLLVAAPGVLANDTDANGDPLTAALVAGPSHGSLTLNADGSFSYTPAANFHGTDAFTYDANDGLADSNVATVTITVNPVNDAPVATDDAYATDEDVPLVVAVLANDSDADGDALTAVLVTGPAHGSLALNNDGSFTYTPDLGYYGPDAFTYQANDGIVDSNVAAVSITVNRVIRLTIIVSPDRRGAPSTINTKNNGVVAVAILGDPAEFALTDIDWTTLTFGPSGATVAHDLSDPATWSGHVQDVNRDGIPDLVTHYTQMATGLESDDTQACLTGVIDGIAVVACGAVAVK